jgi:protein-glutamine gamma-glutamyltransferase
VFVRKALALNTPPSLPAGGSSTDLDLRARRFLLIAIFLSQIANVTSISPTVAAIGVAATVLAWFVTTAPRTFVLRSMLLLSTVIVGVIVYITYGKLIGRDSGVALLFMFGPLKLIEAKSARDYMVVWGLGLMLFVASFFENLGLLAAITVAPIIVMYIASLRLFDARADEPDAPTWWSHLKAAGLHTLMGIPLAAMLFVLFPRATAPLWGMRDPTTGRTGLSEEMEPGEIAKLIQNRETAFRVEFEGRKPPQNALYWRGPVLRKFDGVKSSVGDSMQRGEFIPFTPEEIANESLTYTVTADRLDTRWLPVLEIPIAYPTGPAVESTAFHTDAQQIGIRRASNGATAYRVKSFARSSYPGELPDAKSYERQLGPIAWNQRSREFAAKLAANYPDPQRRINALLTYFNQQQFFYTLNPPLYSVGERKTTAIDAFLFDGRRGFCEHYANATTFLLRASGIPARVVTGYQGGEWTSSGYMIVRQSDAHAWVEAWVAGQWIRIDPTAAVAPNRIELGVEQALPEGERSFVNGKTWWNSAQIAALWDQANFGYTKWVIGFDRDRQKQLLRDLGLGEMNPFTAMGWMLIAVSISGVVVALGWWFMRKRSEREFDPSVRLWRRLRLRLNKAGLPIAPHETVSDALARASGRWPEHRAVFDAFTRDYNAMRFSTNKRGNVSALTAAIRQLPYAYNLKRATSS